MALAAAFLVAAGVAGLVPHDTARWLPLHLALVGALLCAVSGATQFLAVTWGAAPAPRRLWVGAQRCLIGWGAVFVVVGRERDDDVVTAVGGASVLSGLAVLGALLAGIARAAIQPRVRPAIVAYLIAIALGMVGAGLGTWLSSGGGGSEVGRLRDIHATVNLLGLAGFVIAGTLPMFVATQAKTKMSRRNTAPAQFSVQATMASGLALTVIGLLGTWDVVTAAGLGLYGAALVELTALLPRVGTKQLRWAGPRLVQSGAAISWWIGGVALAAVRAARGDPPFAGAVVPALVLGAYVQLIVAALAYIGPVLIGGGHVRLAANLRRTRSWVGLAAGNVATLAACVGSLPVLYGVAVTVWVIDGTARAMLLLADRAGRSEGTDRARTRRCRAARRPPGIRAITRRRCP
jgi:hypothetical protein